MALIDVKPATEEDVYNGIFLSLPFKLQFCDILLVSRQTMPQSDVK